ncbi:uncharacterized protein LOC111873972 [Cryptotermes secundus]|uniref:uncharacterized protein LOC111873972 n=1 Tax=Cryptotermes secundus TaxID=105785 RepID=UPI000CD7D812|nr:uncharacterized protein LOC111873972 [Cryptotermes secundus]
MLGLTVLAFMLLLVGLAMKSADAEVPGSSSTRLENPADIFRNFSLNPAPVSMSNSSGRTKTSEVFEKRGTPPENTSDKQNFNCNNSANQELRSTSSVTGNKTQIQNCDDTSTETPGKYFSVTENKPQITSTNATTKDVLQKHGFVGEDGKPDGFQTSITAPSPEVVSMGTERGTSAGTTVSATDASGNNATEPFSAADTETTPVVFKETYSTPGTSASEFQTITTPLPFSAPPDLWWGGSKKRAHGQHKAQKMATLLKMASKGKSFISNRRNDRRRRLK